MFLQIATHGILKYCLRGLLGKQQRNTLFFILDTLTDVLAESMKLDSLPKLQDKMNTALAMLERDFPIALQVICMAIYTIPPCKCLLANLWSRTIYLYCMDGDNKGLLFSTGHHHTLTPSHGWRNGAFWASVWNVDVSIWTIQQLDVQTSSEPLSTWSYHNGNLSGQ